MVVAVPPEEYRRNGQRPLVKLPELTPGQKRVLLGEEIGTQFDAYTRMFASFGEGDVFEVGEWRARDIDQMLRRDGDAMMIEQALVLPMRSTTYSLKPAKGDTGEFDIVHGQLFEPPYSGGFRPGIEVVIAQMCEAVVYRKEFFEKKWEYTDGQVKLAKLAWRPPSTCDIRRNEHTAEFDGFRQRAWWYATSPVAQRKYEQAFGKNFTGYLDIPKIRSFVYVHGVSRNPLTGISDMDVTFWAYKQKQKILFLWYQFLETQALPKIAVYGADQTQANADALAIASMKSSSTAGFQRPPQGSSLFEIIESSGKGADQFQAALTYLAAYQAKSIMGGFLDLGNAATLGRGSYALSQSQSQFFLDSRQAALNEMTREFTREVIAPIVVLNKGADAKIPTLEAAPLANADSQQIVSTLNALAAAPALRVPDEYVLLVAEKAADVFDLPRDKVKEVIDKAVTNAKKQAENASPLGASPIGQGAAAIAGATGQASRIAQQQLQGQRQ